MNKKLNITPFNNIYQRHGYCVHYYNNGDLKHKGKYDNGTEIGYWENHVLWVYPVIYKTTKTYYII